MAMVVVLSPVTDEEPRLGPAALEELARLGVTSIALLRDRSLAGLVLEGWAFDSRDAHQAASVVAGACEGIQILEPLLQYGVTRREIRRTDGC